MILKQFRLQISNWVTNKTFVLIFLSAILSMSSVAQSNTVDSLSFQNLSLELLNNYANIGSATGFIIEKNNVDYLITNLHVVTGLDYFSHAIIDPQQQIPNNIAIWHNAQTLGHWSKSIETLYDRNKNKRWIECEVAGKTVDIIALPLQNLPKGAKLYPVHLKGFNDSITVMPGFSASIIGSPYGQSSDGKLAIWKTGHIASDLDIDANGLPLFLIDATTRPGMSGSMVVLRMIPFLTRQGISMGLGTRFLGVYTAQGNQDELGYVIKPIALKALIDKLP